MAKNPLELARTIAVKPQGQGGAPKKGVHVRDWVKENYPTEFQLDKIKYPFTFEELNDAWKEDQEGGDFYTIASQDGKGFDSAVREEIFNGLVENLGGEYDDYYYRWLGRDNPNNPLKDLRTSSTPNYQSKFAAKYPDRYKKLDDFKAAWNLNDEDLDKIARALGLELD